MQALMTTYLLGKCTIGEQLYTRIMEYDVEIKPTKMIRGISLYENIA